ncbi:T9SS type A sorting domain-containing protein [Hyunsoonleella flava]|uniref:T9SS type A sorting domain-containing protein n=1 Tax=Hyunsoonleella flava TaxID=2527939 RepID=A0A4Q9FGY6_9FLAO|nr:T9SS type A sorting domain-containing protein [Hyunsoonleella flava]TBN00206.1 T9SS type A sorting domain-containing protein [Hyunsoonleella flava]
MMKKITSLLILLLAFSFGYGQTTLYEGDIAITGVNTDNPDQFSFVLLADVAAGTTINFTDNGWLTTGAFTTSEGVVTWTASVATSCGTEIIITDIGGNNYSALDFSLNPVGSAAETDLGFALSAGGDQVIAYQGTLASPTFLYAVHVANGNGWTDATNTQNTALPAGLTDGVNAMTFNRDNCIYDRSVLANQALILSAVSDVANWSGNNGTRQTLGGAASYSCIAAGTCATTVTWNGGWVGGTPDLSTEVVIAANYDTGSGSFSACSLTVNAGINLNVSDNTYVEVENDVTIDGDLTVQSQGNFVQNDNGGSFILNGTASVNKQTPAKADWFYYTYWSSPVVGETIGDAFPNAPADRRFWFNAANFVDTDGDDIDDNADDWQYALAGDIMTPGRGYAATESRFHFPGATGTATFSGAFNTGDIPVTIALNAANTGVNWNFIGNPYPSAIDFDAFQLANSGIIDGAAYFWSQASPPSELNPGNEALNFNLNDYVVYTVGAGAGTTPGTTKFVGSAQGFFVPALTAGTATFTNAMRMADATSNTQFFKTNNTKSSNSIENKLWLNLTSGNGVSNQILVAYVDGATDNYDGMYYDAPKLLTQDYAAALYSLSESDEIKYAIQCKDINSINENEILKFGLSTNVEVATIYSLSVEHFEGDFLSNNSVYLKDNLTNSVHNLSDSDYSFTSEAGEFNDRFEIAFSAAALSNEVFEINANAIKIVQLDNSNIQFTTEASTFKSVAIFDLLGRALYSLTGDSNSETYNLSALKASVYIANIELSNGATVSKKFIKQ